ncbi:hypothetical protein [Leifsonia sp. NPDC080035]|uniref:ApeA N-terminal domain-containing protein n=1 Tax=Leifsonia sp. NPDC080035 TaxID=3143936 RepID=A0AAU7GAM1_9MICO
MSIEKLEPGKTLSGFVIDGVEETPYVVGTLTLDERGVEVELPYLPHLPTKQFETIEQWVDGEALPANLIFETLGGRVSLYGNRSTGWTSGNISQGRFRPDEAVLGDRMGDLQEPLTVTEVKSTLDGLSEWTGFKAIKQETHVDEQSRVKRITAEVESVDEFTWQQGDAKMTITTHWHGDGKRNGLHIDEWVVLTTEFPTSRPFINHLMEQRKVRSLLTLMLGAGIAWRKHEVRDERFAVVMPDGSLLPLFYEVISRRTVRDYALPVPDHTALRRDGVAYLPQLQPAALTRWAALYEEWSRVIDPTVGVLSRSGAFAEDIVISTNLSLEAGGHLLPASKDEEALYGSKKSTSRHIFRCLESLGLDWSEAADSLWGLAEAIADNYNTIKHYDRGEMPPTQETYVIGRLSLVVVRLLALNLLDETGQLVKAYGESWQFQRLLRYFADSNLHIDWKGDFVPASA